jgi:hypothetical protein
VNIILSKNPFDLKGPYIKASSVPILASKFEKKIQPLLDKGYRGKINYPALT